MQFKILSNLRALLLRAYSIMLLSFYFSISDIYKDSKYL